MGKPRRVCDDGIHVCVLCVSWCVVTVHVVISGRRDERIVFGSADRGGSLKNVDSGVARALVTAARFLNIANHSVRGTMDRISACAVRCLAHGGSSCCTARVIPCAADVRVYKAVDGRAYMTHFGRVMPPEDPRAISFLLPETRGMGIFSRFLRPEFVRRYHVPLSPDVYSAFADMKVDGLDHIRRVCHPVLLERWR